MLSNIFRFLKRMAVIGELIVVIISFIRPEYSLPINVWFKFTISALHISFCLSITITAMEQVYQLLYIKKDSFWFEVTSNLLKLFVFVPFAIFIIISFDLFCVAYKLIKKPIRSTNQLDSRPKPMAVDDIPQYDKNYYSKTLANPDYSPNDIVNFYRPELYEQVIEENSKKAVAEIFNNNSNKFQDEIIDLQYSKLEKEYFGSIVESVNADNKSLMHFEKEINLFEKEINYDEGKN